MFKLFTDRDCKNFDTSLPSSRKLCPKGCMYTIEYVGGNRTSKGNKSVFSHFCQKIFFFKTRASSLGTLRIGFLGICVFPSFALLLLFSCPGFLLSSPTFPGTALLLLAPLHLLGRTWGLIGLQAVSYTHLTLPTKA